MTSRVQAQRIQYNDKLVKRARAVDGIVKFINQVTAVVALILLWQTTVALFGWDKNPDSLLQFIKGMADALAQPARGLVKSFPGVGGGTLQTFYLVALAAYALVTTVFGLVLKFLVRVPGA